MEATIIMNACIVNEHEAKYMQGQGPSNKNLSQFVCFFGVYRVSSPFPSVNRALPLWREVKKLVAQ